MKLQRLKPWLVLALIFGLGVVTGVALSVGFGPRFSHPPGMQQMRNHWMAHLTQRLKLTDDQQAKIGPILSTAETQMQAVHRDEIGRADKVMADANTAIAALLTPDQQAELKKMDSERMRMFSGHMRPWGGPPPGGPGGFGGPHPHGGPGGDMPPQEGPGNPPPPNAPAPGQ